jgi:hypothetical protein
MALIMTQTIPDSAFATWSRAFLGQCACTVDIHHLKIAGHSGAFA